MPLRPGLGYRAQLLPFWCSAPTWRLFHDPLHVIFCSGRNQPEILKQWLDRSVNVQEVLER